MKLGIKEVKALMEKKSMNPTEFAFALGYRSPATVYTWLRNKRVPRVAKIRLEYYLRNKRAA